METVATLAVLGLPALDWLRGADEDERLILIAASRRALRLLDTLQRNQAAHVVNLLAKAMR